MSNDEQRRRTLEALAGPFRPIDPVLEKTGLVVREPFALGSKSEREAIVLRAPDRPWALRRDDMSSWQPDPVLEELIGRKVRVVGVVSGSTFVVREIEELPRHEDGG